MDFYVHTQGVQSQINDALAEMEEYLAAKFPVYVALVNGEYAGYAVCRVDSEVIWVESIFVKEKYRRHGIASALHSKSEEIAVSYVQYGSIESKKEVLL